MTAALAWATAARAQAPQCLRIGCAVGYAPFSEIGTDGQLKGFEIDVANALSRHMALQFTPVILDFDGLFPALQSRKIDAIMASAGLKGRRIGVERGTIHERFLAEQFKGSQVLRYATQDQVLLDLKSGRLDATLVDAVIAQFGFLNHSNGRGLGFAGPDLGRDERYYGKGIGVGLRKTEALTLGRRIDEALAALRSSGALKALNDRYFNFDLVTPSR